MDPLSTVAAIAGVTSAAVDWIHLVLSDLERIKNAPQTVLDLKNDIRSTEQALKLLQDVKSSDWESLGNNVADETKAAVDASRKHADEKLSWRDQADLGLFRYQQIKSMSKQLQTCKLTVNVTVSIASLHNSIRQSHFAEEIKEIKETILARRADVIRALKAPNDELLEVEKQLQGLTVGGEAQEVTETEVTQAKWNREALLKQIEGEHEGMDACRRLLNELLAQGRENGVDRSQHVTYSGGVNSALQLGINNGSISGLNFNGWSSPQSEPKGN